MTEQRRSQQDSQDDNPQGHDRTPERQDSRTTPPTTYMFIDSTANPRSSNEAVRVHVMRRGHARRRSRAASSSSPRSGPPEQLMFSEGIITIQSALPPTLQPQRTTAASLPATPQPPISTASSLPHILPTTSTSAPETLQQHHPPRSLTELRLLADQYTDPSTSTLLDLCSTDPAALSAYLSLTTLSHNPPELLLSAECEAQALQTLRTRFQEPRDGHDTGTILAVALLVKVEVKLEIPAKKRNVADGRKQERRANHESASMHRQALTRLIHDAGGIEEIRRVNAELADMLLDLNEGVE